MAGPSRARRSLDRLRNLLANQSQTERVLARLEALERRMEEELHGGRATYMGNGLVLVKAVVDRRNIAYLIPADDRLISPWFIVSGKYETEVTDHFVRTLRPDDHCLDLGANFGYFTCLFARFCPRGKVVGVEPDPAIHALLRDNIHINGFGEIASARNAAVADTLDPVTLYRRVGRPGNTSIWHAPESFTEAFGEEPAEAFTVPGLTLNRLARQMEKLDIVKIDVEGAEPLVFRAAARAIKANPAIQIVMEWSPGQIQVAGCEPAAFLDEITALGLDFFTLAPRPEPLSRDALLGRSYVAGILLTRTPRQA